MEINASDDRTGSALQTRVTDACQMQAVMGSKQPNCVIIDEIDGALGTKDLLLLSDIAPHGYNSRMLHGLVKTVLVLHTWIPLGSRAA